VIALFILLHSHYFHGKRRNFFRNLTEIMAILAMVSAVSFYITTWCSSSLEIQFFQQFLGYGIIGSAAQLLDNYLVYVLFGTIREISRSLKLLIVIYIFITFSSYFAFVSVLPFVVNMNKPETSFLFSCVGVYLWLALYLVYNSYFIFRIRTVLNSKCFTNEELIMLKRKQRNAIILSHRNLYHIYFV